MDQIGSFDDLDEDATYCYNRDTSDDTTYRIEIDEMVGGTVYVQLSYKDGYVSDLTREKFTEHIDDGKVFEVDG